MLTFSAGYRGILNGMLRQSHLLGPRRSPESGWTRVSAGVQDLIALGRRSRLGARGPNPRAGGRPALAHTGVLARSRDVVFSCQARGSVREVSAPCPGARPRLPAAPGPIAGARPVVSARNHVPNGWLTPCRCVGPCAVGAQAGWHPNDIRPLACITDFAGA